MYISPAFYMKPPTYFFNPGLVVHESSVKIGLGSHNQGLEVQQI